MALALAESLAACQTHYSPMDALQRCFEWWKWGHGVDGWDTGATAKEVLRSYGFATGQVPTDASCDQSAAATAVSSSSSPSTGFISVSDHTKLMAFVHDTARSVFEQTGGAGVNAAHRVGPLALATAFISDAQLPAMARLESQSTHWGTVSGDTCAVMAVLCRMLIRGVAWDVALQTILLAEAESKETATRSSSSNSGSVGGSNSSSSNSSSSGSGSGSNSSQQRSQDKQQPPSDVPESGVLARICKVLSYGDASQVHRHKIVKKVVMKPIKGAVQPAAAAGGAAAGASGAAASGPFSPSSSSSTTSSSASSEIVVTISKDGYAPDVLETAIYFVHTSRSEFAHASVRKKKRMQ